jgi:hypothetical protein
MSAKPNHSKGMRSQSYDLSLSLSLSISLSLSLSSYDGCCKNRLSAAAADFSATVGNPFKDRLLSNIIAALYMFLLLI